MVKCQCDRCGSIDRLESPEGDLCVKSLDSADELPGRDRFRAATYASLPFVVVVFFTAGAAMVATPFPTIDPAFESSMEGGGDVAIAVSDRPEVRAVMRGLVSPSYGVSLVQRENSGFIPPHRRFDLSLYSDPVRGSIATAVRNAIEDGIYRFDASDQLPFDVSEELHLALVEYLTHPGASAEEALSSVEAAWTDYEANSSGG